MALLFKRTVDKIYANLIPDAVTSFHASFRYRLLVVVLVIVMSSAALITMAAL